MSTHIGRWEGYTAPWFCRRCSSRLLMQEEERWKEWSAKAASTAFCIWTCKKTSLPSNQLGPKLAEKRSGICIIKFTNWEGCLDLCCVDRYIGEGHSILSVKLPKAEWGWAARDDCPPNVEWNPKEGERRHFGWSPVGQSERGPLEGLSDHYGPRRGDRVTVSVHYQGLP